MSFRNIVWDEDNKSIRGSAVNMFISAVYVVGIILSFIFNKIAQNLETEATFLLGFFGLSLGIWGGKKVIENMQNVSTVSDTIDQVLQKVGIKIANAPDATPPVPPEPPK